MLICGIALIPFLATLLRPPSSSRSIGCLWRWVMTAWFSRPRPQLPAYLLSAGGWKHLEHIKNGRVDKIQSEHKRQERQCGTIYISVCLFVFFFLSFQKKSVCSSRIYAVFRHMVVSRLWPTLIFTATASKRSPLSSATPSPWHPG